MTFVIDLKAHFTCYLMPSQFELEFERLRINGFVKAETKFAVDFVKRSDHSVRKPFFNKTVFLHAAR